MQRIGRWLAALAAVLLATAAAAACPVCESPAGRQVRAGIFNEEFGHNLLVTALPFPVLLGIVALIRFGPWRPGKPGPGGER